VGRGLDRDICGLEASSEIQGHGLASTVLSSSTI
jgi:hypothetical protein